MTQPLLIEAAEYSPFGEARLVVEVTGRWVEDPPIPTGESALVIVDGNGLVHRFAEIAPGGAAPRVGDEYFGSFVIPAQFSRWLESDSKVRAGGATAVVQGAVRVEEGPSETLVLVDERPEETPTDAGSDRFDATVSALREQLSQRVADEARLRGEVSQLRSRLEARSQHFERLEAVQAELRTVVGELRDRVESAVAHHVALESSNAALEAANASLSAEVAALRQSQEEQRQEVQRLAAELVATRVSYDTALEEVEQLRRELDRGGAELAEVRERSGADELDEAESLLAEARALTARLTGE
jgi:hypothetical protein